jgi:hypothetical protein
MIQTDMYFGLSRPDGTLISDEEWQSFADSILYRVLQNGSTTLSGTGRWWDTDQQQLIIEPAKVVTFIHRSDKLSKSKMDSVCNLYKVMFQQQSVLMVDQKVKVTF